MNEKLAKKISKTLTELCPAFTNNNASTAVWHGCKCAANGSFCVCVWHLTSECNGGKWKELSFLDVLKDKTAKKQAVMLDQVLAARRN